MDSPPTRPVTPRSLKKGKLPVEVNPLLLEAQHLRAKKRFSQNFLVDQTTIAQIVACLNLTAIDEGRSSHGVIEIGSGAGFLTDALLATGAQVVAIEVDRAMVARLRHKFTPQIISGQLQVLAEDVLKVDIESIVDALAQKTGQKPVIVGNLPYAITSPILFRLAGELGNPSHALRQSLRQVTVMVQREVGERITAQPGCKAYNALSVALQYWFEAKLECIVPARSFFPAPKVQSAVITLSPREEAFCAVNDLTRFAQLVKSAFTQRRKTLKNVLGATVYTAESQCLSIAELLEAAQVHPQARADSLSIATLGELSNLLYPKQ